jgi:AraC-like DNA-binding protein
MRLKLVWLLLFFLSCQTGNKKQQDGDTEKVSLSAPLNRLLTRQQLMIEGGQMDSALILGKEIRRLAIEQSDSLAIVRSVLAFKEDVDATHHEEQSNWLRVAIPFLERNGCTLDALEARIMLSGYLSSIGNYKESQELIIPAWKSAELTGHQNLLPRIGLIISNNFSGIDQPRETIAFLHASTRIATEQRDSVLLPSLLMNTGIWHYQQKTDSAQYYYRNALAFIPEGRGEFMRMKILYNMAVALEETGKTAEAEARYEEMASTSLQNGQFEALSVAYKALGILKGSRQQFTASRLYLEKAVHLADSIHQPFLKLQGMIELQSTYEKSGAYREALATSKQVEIIKDSIIEAEKNSAIIELEKKYQTEKKESENKNLTQKLRFEKRFNFSLSILLYQRKKFQQERNHSYEALIELYQRERKEGLRQPALPEQYPQVPTGEDPPDQENFLSEGELTENSHMIESIRKLIENDRLFTDPQFRQEDLAEKLGITPRRLSAYLRWSNPPGFYALVNEYRVREARQLLESPRHAGLKLDAIGLLAGFSSRQNFSKVFEQVTGLTPGYYRRKMG